MNSMDANIFFFFSLFSGVFSIVVIIATIFLLSLFKKERSLLREENNKLRKELEMYKNSLSVAYTPATHPFFSHIKYYIDNECWYLGTENPEEEVSKTRRYILNDMLRIKFTFWYCGYIKLFLNEKEFSIDSVKKTVENIVNNYKEEWKNNGLPSYICEAFNKKHDARAEYLYSSMVYLFSRNRKDDRCHMDDFIKKDFLDKSLALLQNTISDINFIVKDVVRTKDDIAYIEKYQNKIKNKNEYETIPLCLEIIG